MIAQQLLMHFRQTFAQQPKTIGSVYNDRISGGQALGQKNTILAIWMAHTYLNPLSSVAPGSYVLWQNIINSYQLWKKRKNEMKIKYK